MLCGETPSSVGVPVMNIGPVLVRVFEGLVLMTVRVLSGDGLRVDVGVVTIVVPMSVFVFNGRVAVLMRMPFHDVEHNANDEQRRGGGGAPPDLL